ncbi:MAG: cation:proton antiporter, partial [Sphingomonas sp.]
LFDVSFALGAFFAGMILSESELSQRAASETLPLRDAFAVLFFVSVGMLFNPHVVTEQPIALIATVAIIMIGKSIAAFLIVRLFGWPNRTAVTIAASLAQIGEFSFILATLGFSLKLIPADARDLILAGAILSIMLNPLLFGLIDRFAGRAIEDAPDDHAIGEVSRVSQTGHIVLIGHGRVGARVAGELLAAGERVTIVEAHDDVSRPEGEKATFLVGNAAGPDVLRRARLAEARMLFVAIPESFEAGQIVEQARAINPGLRIIVRTHGEAEARHLTGKGADMTINGEEEIACRMVDQALVGN